MKIAIREKKQRVARKAKREAQLAAKEAAQAAKAAAKAAKADEEKDKLVHELLLQKKAADDRAAIAIAKAEAAEANALAMEETDANAGLVAAQEVAQKAAQKAAEDKAAFELEKEQAAANLREELQLEHGQQLEEAQARVLAAETHSNAVLAILVLERQKEREAKRKAKRNAEAEKLKTETAMREAKRKDAVLGASAADLLAELDAEHTPA